MKSEPDTFQHRGNMKSVAPEAHCSYRSASVLPPLVERGVILFDIVFTYLNYKVIEVDFT